MGGGVNGGLRWGTAQLALSVQYCNGKAAVSLGMQCWITRAILGNPGHNAVPADDTTLLM